MLEFSVGLFADFEAADQVGADTTLTLKGIQLASLAQDDFRFV